MVKELQSLCLDIQVLDADGNQIELKEDEDALDTFNLARMDAEDERQKRFADEDELADAGFDYVATRKWTLPSMTTGTMSFKEKEELHYELRNI